MRQMWYNDACAPKAKIKIENENPHNLKMKIVRNFENENFYCSLREILKLKLKFENEKYGYRLRNHKI